MLNVADLVSDALVVFGVWKCYSNFKKAEELKLGAEGLGERARNAAEVTEKIRREREFVGDLCTNLEETSYELFKWTIVGEELATSKRDGGKGMSWQVPNWFVRGLRRSAAAFWTSVKTPAIT